MAVMRYLLLFLMVGCGAPYGAPVEQQRSGLYARPAQPSTRAPVSLRISGGTYSPEPVGIINARASDDSTAG